MLDKQEIVNDLNEIQFYHRNMYSLEFFFTKTQNNKIKRIVDIYNNAICKAKATTAIIFPISHNVSLCISPKNTCV